MSAGWVAGSVRSQAIARRRLGTAAVRRLAGAGSLAEALETLASSPYRRVARAAGSADPLAAAQREVTETLLWNVRVLAGWLPAAGVRQLRLLAGWFEIANVDEHLRALAGQPAEPPYRLGSLATAWPRLAATGSASELRAALAASPWGDPGGSTDRQISAGMRLPWAHRVAARVPAARPWAASATALLTAREGLLDQPDPGPDRPADLWAAELRWWRRLDRDGQRLLAGRGPGQRGGGFGPERMLGAVALLATDAWLVQAALELAARGGDGSPEVLDALA